MAADSRKRSVRCRAQPSAATARSGGVGGPQRRSRAQGAASAGPHRARGRPQATPRRPPTAATHLLRAGGHQEDEAQVFQLGGVHGAERSALAAQADAPAGACGAGGLPCWLAQGARRAPLPPPAPLQSSSAPGQPDTGGHALAWLGLQVVKLREVIRENDELFFVFEYLVRRRGRRCACAPTRACPGPCAPPQGTGEPQRREQPVPTPRFATTGVEQQAPWN